MSNSNNYIINFSKILGAGATAKVYLGVKLDTGTLCALKCSKELLDNEVATLEKLDHNNIIKFYDSFLNYQGYSQVITMEYCNRGSLYEFTQLHQGLCDNMFILVLNCLNDALSYLRKQNLIHRDIKPGNMMVHQDSMGYYLVKLGDLGTAKCVHDGQFFCTLVGTVPYLHPDMFGQYLHGSSQQFAANVDLWSTAITLYHAAVTELPFRSHDSNLIMMKEMYLSKRPGIISGVQNSRDINDITWSDHLPDTCRLSPMLNRLASKLICNLMELVEANTYERFFKEATEINQKQRLLVFNSANGELQMLYLDNLSYDSVVDHIAMSVGHAKEDIIILTRNTRLTPPQTGNDVPYFRSIPIKGHLRYTLTDDTALVLVKKPISKTVPLVSQQLSNDACLEPTDSYSELKEAKEYAEKLMKIIYNVGHTANYIDCQIDCYLATMFSFNEHVLAKNLQLMNEALPWQLAVSRESCILTDSLVSLSEQLGNLICDFKGISEGIIKLKEDVGNLRSDVTDNEKLIESYKTRATTSMETLRCAKQCSVNDADLLAEDNLDFLVHSAEELVNEIKLLTPESVDDENKYKLEIWPRHVRLFEYYKVSNETFEVKSSRVVRKYEAFHDWSKVALQHMESFEKLRHSMQSQESRRASIRNGFLEFVKVVQHSVNEVASIGKTANVSGHNAPINDEIKSRLRQILEVTEKMKKLDCR